MRDVLATQNGSRVASYDYDPYGNASQSSGRVSTDFRYAKLFADQQDGLFSATYRAYDPTSARWLWKDPIEEQGGINLYQYASANPITFVDPLGLFEVFGYVGMSIEGRKRLGFQPGATVIPLLIDYNSESGISTGQIGAVGVTSPLKLVAIYSGVEILDGHRECITFYEFSLRELASCYPKVNKLLKASPFPALSSTSRCVEDERAIRSLL